MNRAQLPNCVRLHITCAPTKKRTRIRGIFFRGIFCGVLANVGSFRPGEKKLMAVLAHVHWGFGMAYPYLPRTIIGKCAHRTGWHRTTVIPPWEFFREFVSAFSSARMLDIGPWIDSLLESSGGLRQTDVGRAAVGQFTPGDSSRSIHISGRPSCIRQNEQGRSR